MFDNVGGKIKAIAKLIFWVTAILFVILGIFIISKVGDAGFGGFLAGVVVIGLGILVAYLSSIVLYAFGEYTENIYIIANNSAIIANNIKKD